jgi:glycerol uptake facilitator protein
MTPFVAELVGTFIAILLGNSVVANVLLKHTKGHNSGWIIITLGWSMALFVGVFIAAPVSGAHLNPAVTIALAVGGKFAWASVPAYIAAQLLGCMLGTLFMWVAHKQHFDASTNPDELLAVFCTSPAIPNVFYNLCTEAIATFVLVFACLNLSSKANYLGSVDALPVALIVLAVGLCMGGPTGYAVNPARDFGPRIMHAILPIKGKRNSNWRYSWIPIVGPIIGGILAMLFYQFIN